MPVGLARWIIRPGMAGISSPVCFTTLLSWSATPNLGLRWVEGKGCAVRFKIREFSLQPLKSHLAPKQAITPLWQSLQSEGLLASSKGHLSQSAYRWLAPLYALQTRRKVNLWLLYPTHLHAYYYCTANTPLVRSSHTRAVTGRLPGEEHKF